MQARRWWGPEARGRKALNCWPCSGCSPKVPAVTVSTLIRQRQYLIWRHGPPTKNHFPLARSPLDMTLQAGPLIRQHARSAVFSALWNVNALDSFPPSPPSVVFAGLPWVCIADGDWRARAEVGCGPHQADLSSSIFLNLQAFRPPSGGEGNR